MLSRNKFEGWNKGKKKKRGIEAGQLYCVQRGVYAFI